MMMSASRRGIFLVVALLAISTCSCASQMANHRTGPTDPDAPTEFTSTPSGLRYRVLRQSDGAKPTASDEVRVHYAGWLDDETEFDSSYARGEAAEFPLSAVVPGWTEGLQLVGEGGMIELEIPSDLGYGRRGSPPSIPPNATLHFRVELLEIL
ncbi:MAG: FKBP-type peptidyl-prolyl cis-trans isomerase [Pirellulaceae bacterium]|nr:FKBP-type peptidyl-prolyl cis-trans isomerase [Pirellulaceae bacterium]